MSRKNKASSFFREVTQAPTTAQERTDAAVRLIREADAEARADQTARLRSARMTRDGATPATPPAKTKPHH